MIYYNILSINVVNHQKIGSTNTTTSKVRENCPKTMPSNGLLELITFQRSSSLCYPMEVDCLHVVHARISLDPWKLLSLIYSTHKHALIYEDSP